MTPRERGDDAGDAFGLVVVLVVWELRCIFK